MLYRPAQPARLARMASITLALTALAGWGAVQAGEINSNLQIDAGKTFELGGDQDGDFTVTGRNTGPVAVEVLAKAECAEKGISRAVVPPGGKIKATFGAGETAMLRNTSDSKTAKLKLTITGNTESLAMNYSPSA